MKSFALIFDSYKPLPVVARLTILDIYGGSAHAPEMREKKLCEVYYSFITGVPIK